MPHISRIIPIVLLLLAACGQAAPGGGASAPTQPPAPTQPEQPTEAPAPTRPTDAPAATQPARPTDAPATTQPAQPTDAPAPTQPPQPTEAAADTGGNILVIYQKSGGFIGIDETLTVYADGTLALNSDGAAQGPQAAPSDLNRLKQLLASPEFASLASEYRAQGADLFTYTITVPGGGKPQTVTTMDGAQNPPVLNQVLEELGKLRGQAG